METSKDDRKLILSLDAINTLCPINTFEYNSSIEQ